ncbi:3-oxoacyl-ACP synthase [Puniceibacterium sp. IMCC21224]|uniref:3-oxoacyl-ACP synthase n=1 Tax=Puniceibacterium sp. IMCC21224 TaxID=1618204 RepID=UPI00064DFBF7|nr:3-oxoacyl-ACP synthase [Puniceibacterium sp. IMCC21224]KMK65248.1 3-oxoacyl-ACP synthase I [Puniceibacterium sp. IMCC21224]
MSTGVNILSAGMVTPVGLTAAASCAAMRGSLDGVVETQFVAPGGDWLLGAQVPLPRNWLGEKRLAHMAAGAVVDALEGQAAADLQIVLCLAETDRPGRPVRDTDRFGQRVLEFSGLAARTKLHVVTHGRPSGIVALERVRRMFARDEAGHALILGVDSLLSGPAIAHYLRAERLLTGENPNGFIPGEAAAAILCAAGKPMHFALTGLGLAREQAFLYNPEDKPLRGDGMTQAYRDALDMAGLEGRNVEYRLSDICGEAYFFKQTALAQQRTTRHRTEVPQIWSPGECVGNVGAAFVPLMVGWALTAFERGYGPGAPVLIESSGDDGACGAAVFQSAQRAKIERAVA